VGKPLPARRMVVYWAIIAYKATHDGCSPALTDLMETCKIRSKSTIKYHLTRLENAGLIRKPKHDCARGIEVTGGSWICKTPKSWKNKGELIPGREKTSDEKQS